MSDNPSEDETEPKVEAETTPRSATLHRSRTTKVFGGVAGGIGERFDVDANIVRVVFVVLALVYGLGIAVYLALWALVPRAPSDGNEEMAQDEVSAKRGGRWLRYVVIIGVIALFVIFLTNLQGHHVVGPGFGKGVALLWLVFLAILAVITLRTSTRGSTFGRFLAWSFFSVITFLILTVGAFLVLLQVLGVPIEGGSGAKTWSPTSIAQVQRDYHGAYGTSTIDLADVPFTSGTWSITATQGVGNLTVYVPTDAVVSIRSHVGLGVVEALNYGWLDGLRSTTVPAKDAPHLNLNLQVGIGQINVARVPLNSSPSS
jgi:phage shock protein PspC (stress-responsive transcriptional regulator)/predicted membrane protein